MDKQRAISVNIINRNYPPNSGITGESAAELAAFLIDKKFIVNIIHVDADYQKGAEQKKSIGNTFRIRTFYNGKNKFLRLFSNLYEGILLIKKSQALKPDITICMTEPPLLNICAALLFSKQQKWILWTMDLFPEALSAGKILSKNNRIYKFLDNIVKKNKPRHIISLGDHQISYLKNKFTGIGFTKLPCGIYSNEVAGVTSSPPSWAGDKSKILLGYCGNIGEAHSAEFIIAIIKNLDPDRHKLILALYGSKAQQLINYATGKPGVEIVKFVRREELKYIDVHLASLDKEWINVCVPSKTVSSVCSGAAFLYYGQQESDNWSLLKDAGWLIASEGKNDLDSQLKLYFKEMESSLQQKKIFATQIAQELVITKKQGFQDIYATILKLVEDDERLGTTGSSQ